MRRRRQIDLKIKLCHPGICHFVCSAKDSFDTLNIFSFAGPGTCGLCILPTTSLGFHVVHLWVGFSLSFEKTLVGNSDGLSEVIAIPEEWRQPISMGKQRGHNPGIEDNAPLTEMKRSREKMSPLEAQANTGQQMNTPGHIRSLCS